MQKFLSSLRAGLPALSLFLAGVSTLSGQAYDSTPGVPVRVWGAAFGKATTGTAQVQLTGNDFLAASGGGTANITLNGTTTSTTDVWFQSDDGTAHMEPGKVYSVTVNGTFSGGEVTNVALNAAPPLGYEVEIDYTRRQRADTASSSHTYTVRLLGSREQSFMAAGAGSQLMVGRIYWQLGLGALRNGQAAGSIAIVDAGASADWSVLYTPSALQYETPSPEIVPVRATGGVLRQVIANQAVVDIVAASSTAYDIKFYHPAQASGSGTSIRTFSGDPYLKYRVEQGATSTTLKITSETRNTTAANSWTASVVRTAVTSLARVDDSPAGWPTYTWTRSDWNTSGQTQVAEQVTTSAGTTGDRTDTLVVQPGGGGTDASYRARTYHLFSWGEEITGDTAGSSNGMTTTYDYYDNAANAGSHGFLKSIVSPGGGWEAYEYWDAAEGGGTSRLGTLKYRFRPFKNSPASVGFSTTTGEVASYDFAADPFGVYTRPTLVETRVDNVLTAKSATSYSDVSGAINGATVVEATRNDYSASAGYLTTVTRFYKEDTVNLFLRNQVHSVTRPDNVKVAFAYQQGSWNGSAFTKSANDGLDAGSASRLATITGTTGSGYTTHDGWDIDDLTLVDGKSTLEVVIRDSRALVVRTESHAWVSGAWQQVAAVDYVYDTMGRLISRTASNGATYTCEYSGEQKTFEVDESGVRTDYEYDHAGRLSKVKKQNTANSAFTTTVTYGYDPAGRVISETVSGAGTSETVVNTRAFDTAGRVTSKTPAGLGATTHSYDVANRAHTATTPDSSTRTETWLKDGRLEKVDGTGTVSVYYAYTIESDGRRLTQVNSGTSSSARLEKAWSDWLGRPIKSEKPGFSQSLQSAFITENFYDDATIGQGRLYKTTRTGYAATYYSYDSLGLVTRSGLDVGGNNALDNSSTDRITERDQYVESFSSAWWLRTDTKVYFPGSGAATTASTSRLRLTGHGSGVLSEAQETDIEGDTSTSTVAVNRSAKTVTTTTTVPGVPNSETATIVNGLATSFKSSDGLTYTSEYDALERLLREKDPRHTAGSGNIGYTAYAYASGTGRVASVTDAAGNAVSTVNYDTMGRVSWSRNAESKYTRLAYNARGQLHRQWGDGAYPVEYGYDSTYGDRTTQSTYRAAPASDNTSWPSVGTADTTTWAYDAATGLLWKKTDAAGKIVELDYNVRGQTASRKWARTLTGSSTKVTTSYGYDSATGELLTQTYNDTGETIPTPGVTYTYDRLGRTATVADAAGTRTFTYDASSPWRLQDETLPAFFGSRVLTQLYDASTSSNTGTLGSFTKGTLKGRSAGFELGVSGNTDRDLRHAWVFSNQPRFAAVSAALNEGAAADFIYAYKSSSALLDGYTRGSFTTSRDYETNRDLVTRLESQWGAGTGSTRTRFDYTYDTVGRRKTAKQSGTAYADYYSGQSYSAVYNVYGYNARGELETAAMYRGDSPSASPPAADELPGRRFEYRYDSIGNRKTSGATATTSGASGEGADEYTANALNQYTGRENNKVAVAGTAAPAPGTTVAVGGASSTSRKDRAYGAEFTPANSADPVIAPAAVYAAQVGGGSGGLDLIRTDTSKNYLVPKRAQAFTHDDDGNLTSDGLWTYTWNAENQLVRATCALPSGFGSALSYVRKRLDLKYDHAGRRIEKRVLNIDTSTEILARRFVYDGHNLIAELNGDGSAIQRSYTWGLDAGGSLTASSAPGSLLQITNYSSGTPGTSYNYSYDDQGNVASLMKASDGSLAAVYEYDPYGNLIRNEVLDSAVADNPFRHATNYRDEETGLVYYGYRYYDPVNGRFLNQDPIGEAGGLNLYGFIGNSGVNGSDYLGMQISSSTIRVNADAMPDDGSWGDFIGATPQPDFVGESWPYFIPRIPANPTIIFTRRTDVVGPQPPEVIEVFPPTPEDKPPTVVVTTPNPNTPPPLVPDTPTKPSSAPAGVMASGTPRGSPDVPGSKVQFAAPNNTAENQPGLLGRAVTAITHNAITEALVPGQAAWNRYLDSGQTNTVAGIQAGGEMILGVVTMGTGTLLQGGRQAVTTTVENSTTKWIWGQGKGVAKMLRQLEQRGWTPQQITEAIQGGKQFPAQNMVNPGNAATRFVNPTTGRSVVIDNVTKEVIHVGGDGFKYP